MQRARSVNHEMILEFEEGVAEVDARIEKEIKRVGKIGVHIVGALHSPATEERGLPAKGGSTSDPDPEAGGGKAGGGEAGAGEARGGEAGTGANRGSASGVEPKLQKTTIMAKQNGKKRAKAIV
jgi:hypothetical protein